MNSKDDKFNPELYLRPTFSPNTKISRKPVAVITASDIARINRRIALSLKQYEYDVDAHDEWAMTHFAGGSCCSGHHPKIKR